MVFKFDRQGNSNLKFFNYDTNQYEPVYSVSKSGKEWVVFNRRDGRIECACRTRKECESEMARLTYKPIHDEIEDGWAEGFANE